MQPLVDLVDLTVNAVQQGGVPGMIPVVLPTRLLNQSGNDPAWCQHSQHNDKPCRHGTSALERFFDFSGGQLAVSLVGDSEHLHDTEDSDRTGHDSGLPHLDLDNHAGEHVRDTGSNERREKPGTDLLAQVHFATA
jgi:hypothetical protein